MRTRLRHSSAHIDAEHEPPLAGGYTGPPGMAGAEGGCADTRVRCIIASMYDQLPSDPAAPWVADAAFLPAGIDDESSNGVSPAPTPPVTVSAYRRVASRVARHRRALSQ